MPSMRGTVMQAMRKSSENERMALMFADVLSEADESTRKRCIAAAMEMPPEFWDNIYEYAKKITGSA